jgi:hypothetical protein
MLRIGKNPKGCGWAAAGDRQRSAFFSKETCNPAMS